MVEVLSLLGRFAGHLVTGWGLAGVLLAMTLESVGIPIPSEVVMPLAGFGSAGPGGLAVVVAAGTVGNLLGSWLAYGIGAAIGVEWRGSRYLDRRHWERAHRWFARYGDRTVLLGRVLPLVRTYISFPAGALSMPAGRFTLYTLLGSAVWSAALAVAGYELGSNWAAVGPWLARYALVSLGLVVVGVVAWWWRSRRAAGRSAG